VKVSGTCKFVSNYVNKIERKATIQSDHSLEDLEELGN